MIEISGIYIWAPLMFGAMIGWIVTYYMRKYRDFSPWSLVKTAGVFIGGVGFASLSFFTGNEIGVISIMCYFLGSAVGFFLHWIYQLVVSICFKSKFSSAWDQYLLVSSCSLSAEDQETIRQLGIKATLINEGFEQLTNKMIDENEFQCLCKKVSLTKSDFVRMQNDEYIGGILEPKAIAYIEAKGLSSIISDL